MYKHVAFLLYEGALKAFEATVNSLSQAAGFEMLHLILVFEKRMYELPRQVLSFMDSLPSGQFTWVTAAEPAALVQAAIKRSGAEVLLFIREGESVDVHYLEYIDYFFEENHSGCAVLFTCAAGSESLPKDGISPLDALPDTLTGASVFLPSIQDIKEDITLEMDAFTDLILKAALRDGCFGVINTVACHNARPSTIAYTAALYKSLVDFSLSARGAIPESLQNQLEIFVHEQIQGPLENFQPETLDFFPYISNLSEELMISSGLVIEDIENHYEDQVKVSGSYVLPARWVDFFCVFSEGAVQCHLLRDPNQPLCYADTLQKRGSFVILAALCENAAELAFGFRTDASQNGEAPPPIDISIKETGGNYKAVLRDGRFSLQKSPPSSHYWVSCVVPVYNGAGYLKDAVESVFSQSIGFFPYVQLILVNDGSTDQTEEICLDFQKRFPLNVTYIYQEKAGVSAARNHGLRHAVGKYVSFLDADDKLAPGFWEAGVQYLDAHPEDVDFAAFPIEYFDTAQHKKVPRLNFRFDKDNKDIDAGKDFHCLQISVCSALFKRTALEDLAFDEALPYYEDADFVHKVLLKRMRYGAISKPPYFYRAGNPSATQNKSSDIDWYAIPKWMEALVNASMEARGKVTLYTQYLMVHILLDYTAVQVPAAIESQLDVPSLFAEMGRMLRHVEDDVILKHNFLSHWHKWFLLKLKHQKAVLKSGSPTPAFYFGAAKFENLHPKIFITALSEKNQMLRISGFYQMSPAEGAVLAAEDGANTYVGEISENIHKNTFFLGQAVHKAVVFDFAIPCEEEKTLAFTIRIDAGKYPVRLVFPHGKSPKESKELFFAGENLLITAPEENHKIRLEKLTLPRLSKLTNNWLKLVPRNKFQADYALAEQYLQVYPFMSQKRIWLFMDKPNAAGGPAEHFFQYASTLQDGIDKYFVVSKNTLDAVRLEDAGKILDYGGETHKLLYLFAEKIIVSNALDRAFEPFKKNELYWLYRSLSQSETVYLPEQVPPPNQSAFLNCFTREIALFAVSSAEERRFVLNGGYGYGEDAVRVTGRPQYDALLDNSQNRILFAPTWRTQLYAGENEFNFDFGQSEYCAKITALLCDDRLAEAMQEYEYEMDFMPDEKIFLQVGEIDMFDNVNTVSPAEARLELYGAGSLLITDFRPGFEFAYMKKPVIYYAFAEEEGNPEAESFFKVETMGFGEVISEHETLVDLIIKYMKKGCKMEKKWKQRVEAYFGCVDRENRKRIYEVLTEKK
ncbi:MAG: bifunctional glycosyltransferase family 2 protein/CDP-glycerol:glycerophosphate glycerophosphotransferase [Clostridiales bacterium]|jgi:glycosyltransferase involved in cell wall biosynthesis|nr:bifunctional glycosyltransferase family 2 protein/CDP-glycerol:glycerophosphate glycerophosphotransferase [Clostridiales bacterium]